MSISQTLSLASSYPSGDEMTLVCDCLENLTANEVNAERSSGVKESERREKLKSNKVTRLQINPLVMCGLATRSSNGIRFLSSLSLFSPQVQRGDAKDPSWLRKTCSIWLISSRRGSLSSFSVFFFVQKTSKDHAIRVMLEQRLLCRRM